MVGKPLVLLFIDQKTLALVFFLDALHQVKGVIAPLKIAMDGEKILSMADVLCIKAGKTTFAKGEIVDGIKQVGFPDTIVPDETVDLLRKDKLSMGIIFKPGEDEFLKVHFSH